MPYLVPSPPQDIGVLFLSTLSCSLFCLGLRGEGAYHLVFKQGAQKNKNEARRANMPQAGGPQSPSPTLVFDPQSCFTGLMVLYH